MLIFLLLLRSTKDSDFLRSKPWIVLSSDAASLPEVLGDAAVYFESNNVNDLYNKLTYMVSANKIDYNAYFNRMKGRVALFNWKNEANKLLSYLEQSLQNNS